MIFSIYFADFLSKVDEKDNFHTYSKLDGELDSVIL